MIGIEMPMPKSCEDCMFSDVYVTMRGDKNIYCENPTGFTSGEWVKDGGSKRHEDCPLVDLGKYEDDLK